MEPVVSRRDDRPGAGQSLVVVSASGRYRRIPIPVHGIVLGRDGPLGPPFSTNQFVSRKHASVRRRGDGGVEISDLGSANGTYINGTQVHDRACMQVGDVLRIGQIEMKLDLAPAIQAAPDASIPCLSLLGPAAYRGRRIRLPGEYMVVGREPTCDVHLDYPYVSRTHAALQRCGDAVYVQDLGSSAGTFVNGARVTAARRLHPGDIVTLANVQARFEPAGAVTAEASPAPAEPVTVSSSHHSIGRQRGEIINNVGRDQHNSYVQHVTAQRENFLREIAATKTRARWLIWTGVVSFVAGFGLFAAGVLSFVKQVSSNAKATAQPSGVWANPIGQNIGGIPSGLIGWAMAALGMLLITVGLVLHIVATSRRRRVDRELPVPPAWLGASPAGRAT
jgi:pSer/pThr/pTyr-binding forkhead associated (FHA) protein